MYPPNLLVRRAPRCGFLTLGLILGLLVPRWGVTAERWNLAQTLADQGYDAVALRRTGEHHLFLFAKVDGRRRSCLLDTGWSFTTFSTNTAGRLAVSNLIPRLTLGRVVLTNESGLVQDLRVRGQPAPYDMVLGCDFLRRHHAIIDCAAPRLYLRNAPLPVGAHRAWEQAMRGAGFQEINLQLRAPPALTCTATINDVAGNWLVDSGAMWSCLDDQVAQTLQVRARPTLNRMMGAAANDARAFAVADLKSWRLDAMPMPATSVAVFPLKDWGMGPSGKIFPDVGGILGGAELHKFRAVIDCGGLKLWVRGAR